MKVYEFKAINNRTVLKIPLHPLLKCRSHGITLMFFGSWFQNSISAHHSLSLIHTYQKACCFVVFFALGIIRNKLLCTLLGIFITSKMEVFDVRKIHLSIHAFHFVLVFDRLYRSYASVYCFFLPKPYLSSDESKYDAKTNRK